MFIGCGLIYMVVKAPPVWLRKPATLPVIFMAGAGFWNYSKGTMVKIGLFFLKAGTFVFGSGLAIVPFCMQA